MSDMAAQTTDSHASPSCRSGSIPGGRCCASDALGMRGVPAPEPSVLFGRRMFLLHVDGDGFESISTVAIDSGSGKSSAEVFRERVVGRFKIPMTISVDGITSSRPPDETR